MKPLEFHLLLRRILICTYILVRQGKSQCIQCNQTGLSVLGQPLTITCSIIAPVEDLISVRIYKDQTNLLFVPIDYAVPKPNVTFFEPDAGKRLNVVVKDTSETSRSVSVVFGNLECQDNGTYEWVLRVSSRKVLDVTQQQHVIVKVYPQFNSFDIFPITIMPDSNLYQGDVVTFICMGDVGNNPVGTLGWYFYIQGDGTSVQNFTSLATPGSVHSNKTCSMTAVSMLTFKITEQMREFVVRCTVTQGAPFTMTGLGYKETPFLKVKERRAMEKVESSTSTGLTIVITLLVIGVLVIVTIQFLRRHYNFQFSRKDAGNHAEVANVSVTSVADGEAEVASSTYYSEPTVVPLQTSSAHSVSHQSMSEYTWQESL